MYTIQLCDIFQGGLMHSSCKSYKVRYWAQNPSSLLFARLQPLCAINNFTTTHISHLQNRTVPGVSFSLSSAAHHGQKLESHPSSKIAFHSCIYFHNSPLKWSYDRMIGLGSPSRDLILGFAMSSANAVSTMLCWLCGSKQHLQHEQIWKLCQHWYT